MVACGRWFFANGVGHFVYLLVDNNNAPFNARSILYTDLLTPLLVVLLLWLSSAERFRLR